MAASKTTVKQGFRNGETLDNVRVRNSTRSAQTLMSGRKQNKTRFHSTNNLSLVSFSSTDFLRPRGLSKNTRMGTRYQPKIASGEPLAKKFSICNKIKARRKVGKIEGSISLKSDFFFELATARGKVTLKAMVALTERKTEGKLELQKI